MSSTNRGGDRHASDYYVTPHEPISDFLSLMLRLEPSFLSGSILDPCAGGDEDHPMSYPSVLVRQQGVMCLSTMDIRPDSRAGTIADYLTTPMPGYDLIITNPPFALALPTRLNKLQEGIIDKALREVNPGGWVAMLLRLNFFGSDDRFPFLREHMPAYCIVHHRRISFTGGPTDSIEYAHFVWRKGRVAQSTQLYLL